MQYATEKHDGQVRKFTGEPHSNHPIEVAKMVAEITDDCEMICAALLHDVIEDCGVTKQDLLNAGFGYRIAKLVTDLTNIRSGKNRATRKAGDREHLSNCSARVQTIKVCDIWHNAKTMHLDQTDFGKLLYSEPLEVLDKVDSKLRGSVIEMLEWYIR